MEMENDGIKDHLSFSNFGILDLPVPYIFHRAQIRGIHHTGVTRFHYDTVRPFLGGFLIGENRVIVLLLPLGRCPLFICLGICKRRQVRESILVVIGCRVFRFEQREFDNKN